MHILLWNAAPTHTPCSKHRRPLALSGTRKGLCGRSPCRVRQGHSGPTTSQTPRHYRYLWRGKMLGEVCVCVCSAALSYLTLWQLRGVQPARLLCPWESPGKNTGVGCHFLLQGTFLIQGSNLHLTVSCIGRQILYWHVLIRRLTTWTLYVWS